MALFLESSVDTRNSLEQSCVLLNGKRNALI
jgi:hypothetical protein